MQDPVDLADLQVTLEQPYRQIRTIVFTAVSGHNGLKTIIFATNRQICISGDTSRTTIAISAKR
jgi:hypothetical protein